MRLRRNRIVALGQVQLVAVTHVEPHPFPSVVGPLDHREAEHVAIEARDRDAATARHVDVDVVEHRHRQFLRRRTRTRMSQPIATRTSSGATRFATGAPAVWMRSTGSASGWSTVRTPRSSPLASPPAAASLASLGSLAASPALVPAAAPLRTFASRHSTNWSSSLALTSASTPRPNWATLPVTVRSVTTLTRVPSPSGVSVAVMVALALPWPRVSR